MSDHAQRPLSIREAIMGAARLYTHDHTTAHKITEMAMSAISALPSESSQGTLPAVTDEMVEAGARGMVAYVVEWDTGPSFDEMTEESRQEACGTARVCLTAALSIVTSTGTEAPAQRPLPDASAMVLIKKLAWYYDVNDCAEWHPDDSLEVPISDLKAARDICAVTSTNDCGTTQCVLAREALDNSNGLFASILLERRPDEEIEDQIMENRRAYAALAPLTSTDGTKP